MTVDGKALDPGRDLGDHSAGGFDWGSAGTGATQLALALLANHAGDEVALRAYRRFESAVVAGLPFAKWTLIGDDIDAALAVLETEV